MPAPNPSAPHAEPRVAPTSVAARSRSGDPGWPGLFEQPDHAGQLQGSDEQAGPVVADALAQLDPAQTVGHGWAEEGQQPGNVVGAGRMEEPGPWRADPRRRPARAVRGGTGHGAERSSQPGPPPRPPARWPAAGRARRPAVPSAPRSATFGGVAAADRQVLRSILDRRTDATDKVPPQSAFSLGGRCP